MNWERCAAVDRSPLKMGGVWCFAGTRMPVASLFEHLDGGSSLDEFFEWFPGVDPELVHQVLAFTKASLEQPATAA
jgi:uncharacterized protein (DUF433 family)